MNKIAILDVDGVLLDLTPALIKYIKSKYKVRITAADITTYDWGYCLGLPNGCNSEDLWKVMWQTPAKPYYKALEFIQILKNQGYYVQGLSKRITPNSIAAATRDFPQLKLDACELVADKADWLLKNMPHAKFVVEDHNKNAVDIAIKTNLDVYLFNRPWNRDCISITKSWKRVYNYQDILKHLKEI